LKRLREDKEVLQTKKRKYHEEYRDSILIPERILALPDELLLKPLSFLSKKDLLSVACVCSKMNQLANDQSLWRALLLRDARIAYNRCPSWTTTITNWKKECLQKCLIHIYEVGRKMSLIGEDQTNHWAVLEPLYFSVRALRQRICSFVYLPPHKVKVRVSLTKPKERENDWGFFLDDFPRETTIKSLGFKGLVGDLYVSVERCVDFADVPHSSFWWHPRTAQVEDDEIEHNERVWIPSDIYPWFLELSQAELMQQLEFQDALTHSLPN